MTWLNLIINFDGLLQESLPSIYYFMFEWILFKDLTWIGGSSCSDVVAQGPAHYKAPRPVEQINDRVHIVHIAFD